MDRHGFKQHGRAILETAKDHLASALQGAPDEGWTAVEWAEAAGLLLDDAKFPAVFAHHLGPVLLVEGRAASAGDGALPRYRSAASRPRQPETVGAAATAAPQVWGTASNAAIQAVGAPTQGAPQGVADEGQDSPPEGHEGPWIP